MSGFHKRLLPEQRDEGTVGPPSPAAGVNSACFIQQSLFSAEANHGDDVGDNHNNTIMKASIYWEFPICHIGKHDMLEPVIATPMV